MKAALLVVLAPLLANPAAASPCGERIAQFQARYDSAPILAGAGAVGTPATGAETEAAKLHRQPAPATAADANAPAMSEASVRDARFRNALEEARAADHSGDAPACETAMEQAAAALGR